MFLTRRFYILCAVTIAFVAAGWGWAPLFTVGQVMLCLTAVMTTAEVVILWTTGGISATRLCAARFSNGDDNEVTIRVKSSYRLPVLVEIIDEAPIEFQKRDIDMRVALAAMAEGETDYVLHPVRRGAYTFGHIRVFVRMLTGLVQRRFTCGEKTTIKVYPSYLMLRQYELLAFTQKLTEMGIRRLRRPGNNTEFEQIKDYVKGDDYRTINWKATARRGSLMVNVYNEERSQQVFCVIDKGRMMQQTFNGMTCLDYAINATLVLSYIIMHREDKAGVAVFDSKVSTFLPAERRQSQTETILNRLYAIDTDFGDTDFSALATELSQRLSRRSLLIVFTNFSTTEAMRRQLPYLRQLARRHRLLVVFFRDGEIEDFTAKRPANEEGYYQRVIAEQAVFDKQLIVSTLRQHGIEALLVKPESLTVDVINKYLSMRR